MFGLLSRMTRRQWQHTLAGVFLLLLCSSVCLPLQAQSSEFDRYFKDSATRYLYGYFPGDRWEWLKAQAIQESSLRPDAVSPVGAGGLMQIMPATAPEVHLAWADIFDAEKNVRAGAWYMRKRIRAWWPRDTRFQRLQLAWGAYNWGMGNMIKAQAQCGGAMIWEDMAPCVTPFETRHYVEIIPQHYYRLRNEP